MITPRLAHQHKCYRCGKRFLHSYAYCGEGLEQTVWMCAVCIWETNSVSERKYDTLIAGSDRPKSTAVIHSHRTTKRGTARPISKPVASLPGTLEAQGVS